MPAIPEPINWNEVKAFLEAQDKKISIIADGVADIQKRVGRLETAVGELQKDLKDIKGWLQAFNTRLTTVETKLAA